MSINTKKEYIVQVSPEMLKPEFRERLKLLARQPTEFRRQQVRQKHIRRCRHERSAEKDFLTSALPE